MSKLTTVHTENGDQDIEELPDNELVEASVMSSISADDISDIRSLMSRIGTTQFSSDSSGELADDLEEVLFEMRQLLSVWEETIQRSDAVFLSEGSCITLDRFVGIVREAASAIETFTLLSSDEKVLSKLSNLGGQAVNVVEVGVPVLVHKSFVFELAVDHSAEAMLD